MEVAGRCEVAIGGDPEGEIAGLRAYAVWIGIWGQGTWQKHRKQYFEVVSHWRSFSICGCLLMEVVFIFLICKIRFGYLKA